MMITNILKQQKENRNQTNNLYIYSLFERRKAGTEYTLSNTEMALSYSQEKKNAFFGSD